uniref:phytanoyl-CoA dioxygenase n=1 Tax=Epicauta chinensis TaxID=941254 RepID=A0A8K1XY02_9CUCU|nr:phytanoyl-CoA dioxygenase [Epicauta chinensis]
MADFTYTVPGSGVLSQEQRQFYEDNGYIVFKNYVNHDFLDRAKARFIEIIEGRVKKGFMVILKDFSLTNKEGEERVTKIQDWLYDDVLFDYANNRRLLDVVETFTGPNITAVHSMLINKPPQGDPQFSYHHVHQDLHFFPFRPSERIVAALTAIEPMTPENGCLYVVPGTHKGQFYPHTYPEGFRFKFYHGIYQLNPDDLPKTYIRLEKGDVIFFHPLILHGSGANLSTGFRKVICCHFASSNCKMVKLEGTQAILAKEVEALFAKRGVTLEYFDLWRAKSRLVQGPVGELQRFPSQL